MGFVGYLAWRKGKNVTKGTKWLFHSVWKQTLYVFACLIEKGRKVDFPVESQVPFCFFWNSKNEELWSKLKSFIDKQFSIFSINAKGGIESDYLFKQKKYEKEKTNVNYEYTHWTMKCKNSHQSWTLRQLLCFDIHPIPHFKIKIILLKQTQEIMINNPKII